MAPAQLARYRTAVDDERRGTELAGLLAELSGAGWEIRGEVLKTAPRGFTGEHPRIDLLRHKSVYAAREYPPDDALHERTTLRRVRDGWRRLRALNEWAADHVGSPDPAG
jgi:hypothetical protein